mmetsp:Transcript_15292/g.53111  ORF Transcript_15292/g.53111 Transcript_15292/m.53111 type:complete len:353 (-) Transcript_15292:2177-3235(-)
MDRRPCAARATRHVRRAPVRALTTASTAPAVSRWRAESAFPATPHAARALAGAPLPALPPTAFAIAPPASRMPRTNRACAARAAGRTKFRCRRARWPRTRFALRATPLATPTSAASALVRPHAWLARTATSTMPASAHRAPLRAVTACTWWLPAPAARIRCAARATPHARRAQASGTTSAFRAQRARSLTLALVCATARSSGTSSLASAVRVTRRARPARRLGSVRRARLARASATTVCACLARATSAAPHSSGGLARSPSAPTSAARTARARASRSATLSISARSHPTRTLTAAPCRRGWSSPVTPTSSARSRTTCTATGARAVPSVAAGRPRAPPSACSRHSMAPLQRPT